MKRYWWIIVAALLLGAVVASEYVAHRRVVPPEGARSLRGFLDWQPGVEQFAIVDAHGEHLIAYGHMSSLLLLSSGPSGYVFDQSGTLVDWSSDIGDDPVFDERWTAQRSRARSVTRHEASVWPATRPGR